MDIEAYVEGCLDEELADESKICCNCVHCQRRPKPLNSKCYCDIDGHYQGYVEVMTSRCDKWELDE